MPERRHLWRGIHDADMVRSGLTITAAAGAARYRPGDVAVVTLRVTSTRVGHAFPTYVTPRVVLSGELVDGAGQPIAGSRQEKIIGREVALDLSREAFDTRILPGRSATLEYRIKVPARGTRARLAVVVQNLDLIRELANAETAGDKNPARARLVDSVLSLPGLIKAANDLTSAIARLADLGPGKKAGAMDKAKAADSGVFATPSAPNRETLQ